MPCDAMSAALVRPAVSPKGKHRGEAGFRHPARHPEGLFAPFAVNSLNFQQTTPKAPILGNGRAKSQPRRSSPAVAPRSFRPLGDARDPIRLVHSNGLFRGIGCRCH